MDQVNTGDRSRVAALALFAELARERTTETPDEFGLDRLAELGDTRAGLAALAQGFERLKSMMVEVGMVRTFENFLVRIPADIDPGARTMVIVWCEAFGEFITAARYR